MNNNLNQDIIIEEDLKEYFFDEEIVIQTNIIS